MKKGQLALSYLFIVPAFLLVVVLLLVPMLQNVYYSFFEWDGIGTPVFQGLKNYARLFVDRDLLVSIRNTLIWVLFTLVFPVMGGLLVAGLKLKPSWLTDVPLNTFSMLIAWTWQQLGTSMVMFLMGLSTIPVEPIKASIIDGANKFQTFLHVKFPMLRPITTVVITMAMVNSFKAFDIIYVMTRGGPYHSSETLAVTMFRETFTMFRMGYGAAISVFLSIVVIAVSSIYINRMAKKDLLYY